MFGIPSPLIYWITNSAILYIVDTLAIEPVVLGNWKFNQILAAIVSGFILTIVMYAAKPFIEIAKNIIGFDSDNPQVVFSVNILLATLANFTAIWIIARLSQYSGIGISSYLWVGYLAIILTVTEWLTGRLLEETVPEEEF